MTIWNCIRDWFVQYVFGGIDSNNVWYGTNYVGRLLDTSFNPIESTNTGLLFLLPNTLNDDIEISNVYISMGDWLSTTATIITLCLLVFMLYLFARWIFKQCAGLLSF